MARNLNHFKPEDEASFEIDLAPFLSIVVALIPILLLTAVFMKVGLVDTQLPQIINEAVAQERKEENAPTLVKVEALEKQGLVVEVTHNGRASKREIPISNNDFNYDEFHRELVKVKEEHPMIFRLELRPSSDLSYEKIIKLMDYARKTRTGDPKLFVTDPKTNQKLESNIMFADIFFGNVLEG